MTSRKVQQEHLEHSTHNNISLNKDVLSFRRATGTKMADQGETPNPEAEKKEDATPPTPEPTTPEPTATPPPPPPPSTPQPEPPPIEGEKTPIETKPEETPPQEERKDEEKKPEESTSEGTSGSTSTSKKSGSKTRTKSKSKMKPVVADPAPPLTEEESRKQKERLQENVPKILAVNGPVKIHDEDYLTSRLLYQIFRNKEIANGTYAKLFRAKDKNGKEQAMKSTILSTVPLKYKEHLTTIATKIVRYLMTDSHPSICPVYEVFQSSEKIYTFMQLMHGPSLDQWTKKEKRKENLIKKIFHDVAEGLNFLAVLGIAHNAIHTTHIMLNKDKSCAKLVGFGTSVLTWDPKSEAPLKQKKKPVSEYHHHMAPETVKGDYDPVLADVWSFGCTVVAALAREYPFELKTKHCDKHWKVVCKRHDVIPSSELADMLSKIFVAPDKRMTLQSLLLHPWVNT